MTAASSTDASAMGVSTTGTTIAPVLGLLELGVWPQPSFVIPCRTHCEPPGAIWARGLPPGVGTPGGNPVELLSHDSSSPS